MVSHLSKEIPEVIRRPPIVPARTLKRGNIVILKLTQGTLASDDDADGTLTVGFRFFGHTLTMRLGEGYCKRFRQISEIFSGRTLVAHIDQGRQWALGDRT
jgi:hypothetical protein